MSEQPSTPTKAKPKKKAKAADKAASKVEQAKINVETATAEQQPAQAPPKAAPASPALESLNVDQREMLEKLSANLARAALTAQGAIAEAALRQAERPAALQPDPFHVAPALTDIMGRLASQPDRMVRAQADLFQRYLELWQSAARRAGGETVEPVVSPEKGDKRFNDPDWAENPVFDVIKQSYLLTSNWLNSLVSQVEDVDPIAKRRVEFFMKMLTDAFSPSNFLVSNPAALREAMQTQGASLLKGMENFADDMTRGGGQLAISQTDYQMFKIGENVATAPGKVVFQNEVLQLVQFNPTTEQGP